MPNTSNASIHNLKLSSEDYANPLGNRLAGDGDLTDAIAGKPDSYGSAVHAEIDGVNADL